MDGLYELKAERTFGLLDNFVTLAKNFGDGIGETYNGVDSTSMHAARERTAAQGGFNIGAGTRTNAMSCRRFRNR